MSRDIKRLLEKCLTVGELIEELQGYDASLPVIFTADYGDYHHTEQALPLLSISESYDCSLKESAYSKSGVAVRECEEEDLDDEEAKQEAEGLSCIILRSEHR